MGLQSFRGCEMDQFLSFIGGESMAENCQILQTRVNQQQLQKPPLLATGSMDSEVARFLNNGGAMMVVVEVLWYNTIWKMGSNFNSNREEPSSWEELYNIRKELQGFHIGVT